MKPLRRAVRAWFALPLLFASLAFSGIASAGALQVRDEAHVLSPADIARLRTDVASAPFDARVLVTEDHPDSAELGNYLRGFESEPNMVIVGLDPEHHHVQVRFGPRSHVREGAWTAIEKSGNDAFRRSDWEAGLADIFRTAASAVSSDSAEPTAPGVEQPSRGSSHLLLILGVFVGLALLAAVFFRRRRDYGPGGYGPSYGPGYGEPGYGPPPYGGYGYGPPQGGMGPVGGGLIGAGLGGLAGYELGKAAGEREERDRDGGFGGSSQGGSNNGNDGDWGGGGSDWGGGDSGGGGFDGGGGDGGGGSDF
jgi:hypothetical protein